jgi:hypothetical protein
MKKIMLFLLIIIPCFTYAQSKLYGKVKDSQGHPLDAATITLKLGDKQIGSAFADMGSFTMDYPNAGTYTLFASLVGYQPAK